MEGWGEKTEYRRQKTVEIMSNDKVQTTNDKENTITKSTRYENAKGEGFIEQ